MLKISIVMPTYDVNDYLDRALSSVISQSGDFELELIVLDAGSTDGTVETIRARGGDIAYWHSQPDGGQTYALRDGFHRATGEILGWINGDDLLLQGTLARIVAAYAGKKDDIFFGDYALIDEADRIQALKRVPRRGIRWFAERGHWVFGSTGAFFGREAYDRVGGLNAELEYVMDSDLFVRMLLAGATYKHVGSFVGAFRRHPGAKTVHSAQESRKEHLRAARNYWGHRAARGRAQSRWRALYLMNQLLNGNFRMKLEDRFYRGKPILALEERGQK